MFASTQLLLRKEGKHSRW